MSLGRGGAQQREEEKSCRAQLREKGDATGLSEEGSGGRRACGAGKQERQSEADGGEASRWRRTTAEEAEGGAAEAMVLATVRSGSTREEQLQQGVEGGVAEEGGRAEGRRARRREVRIGEEESGRRRARPGPVGGGAREMGIEEMWIEGCRHGLGLDWASAGLQARG